MAELNLMDVFGAFQQLKQRKQQREWLNQPGTQQWLQQAGMPGSLPDLATLQSAIAAAQASGQTKLANAQTDVMRSGESRAQESFANLRKSGNALTPQDAQTELGFRRLPVEQDLAAAQTKLAGSQAARMDQETGDAAWWLKSKGMPQTAALLDADAQKLALSRDMFEFSKPVQTAEAAARMAGASQFPMPGTPTAQDFYNALASQGGIKAPPMSLNPRTDDTSKAQAEALKKAMEDQAGSKPGTVPYRGLPSQLQPLAQTGALPSGWQGQPSGQVADWSAQRLIAEMQGLTEKLRQSGSFQGGQFVPNPTVSVPNLSLSSPQTSFKTAFQVPSNARSDDKAFQQSEAYKTKAAQILDTLAKLQQSGGQIPPQLQALLSDTNNFQAAFEAFMKGNR